MSKLTRRKFRIQASKRSQLGIHFQGDPANLIKERGRTPEIKTVERKYHLPVEVEATTIAAAVTKSQTKESRGILKAAEKLTCQ